MRLVIYQPDIPQNLGALLRLADCFGLPVDVVEPTGFPFDDRRMRRAGMDYADRVALTRHPSWDAYRAAPSTGRLVLLTTAGETALPQMRFAADDRLLLGRESAGVPADVHDAADIRLRIPIRAPARSLNVALAAAVVAGEALRQTGAFPD